MNKKLIIFSFIIVFLFALYIYTDYKNKDNKNENTDKVYFIQIGAYKNSSNVTKVTKMVNYNYVEYEGGIYYIYVGITKDKEVLNKLKNYYVEKGTDIYIKEKKISNIEFLYYLDKYDSMIKETNDRELIDSIEKDILKKYEKTQ